MANVLERAQSRRAELQTEIERIDTFLAMYQQLVGDDPSPDGREEQSGAAPVVTPFPAAAPMPADPPVKRGPNGSTPDEIVAAVKKVLAENERPMTRYQLVEAVEKRAGVVVGGVDKGRNMGTIMWRSKQFKNTGEGYWFNDGDPPLPADYHEPD